MADFEIGANENKSRPLEEDDPTISIVEPHPVRGCRQRMKLDRRLIALDNEMLRMELSPSWKHLAQLGESAGDEVRLAAVMACERMAAHQ